MKPVYGFITWLRFYLFARVTIHSGGVTMTVPAAAATPENVRSLLGMAIQIELEGPPEPGTTRHIHHHGLPDSGHVTINGISYSGDLTPANLACHNGTAST